MSTTIYLELGAMSPPPRPVKTSLRTRLLLIFGAALFAAVILGGIVTTVEAAEIVWLSIAGRPIMAHVSRIDKIPTPPAASDRYSIAYTFDEPFAGESAPQSRSASIEIPRSAYGPRHAKMFHAGDRIVFRYAEVGGCVLLNPWSPSPYGHVLLFAGIGVTLISAGVVFLLRLSRWHRRRMRLLRHGIGVTGTLVSKRVDSVEGKFYLTYRYQVRFEATTREREEQCTQAHWKLFEADTPVTLLYDPDRVDQVGLYRLLADL